MDFSSSESDTASSKPRHKCTTAGCKAAFSNKKKLNAHILKHTGERPFVCDETGCSKTYTNSSHLRRHKKTSHEEKLSDNEGLLCEHKGCGLVLANKYSMKKHLNRRHNSSHYPFKCKECDQGFHKRRQLQQHTYLHTGEAPFSCDLCDLRFTAVTHLNKHKRNHRTYDCDCGKTFHRWSLILEHKKLCKGSSYSCDQCDRVFTQKTNLNNHKLTHQEQSERLVYACPYPDCERFYFYKKNITFHINYIHKKKHENIRYKCTYPKCTVELKTKQSLRVHLAKMHFKWTTKKQRHARRDKGVLKKRIIPVLSQVSNTNLSEQGNNDKNTTAGILLNSAITDEELFQQCDEVLNALTGESTVPVK